MNVRSSILKKLAQEITVGKPVPEVNADAGERRKTMAEDISLSVPNRWRRSSEGLGSNKSTRPSQQNNSPHSWN
jgi:hypothetical protein